MTPETVIAESDGADRTTAPDHTGFLFQGMEIVATPEGIVARYECPDYRRWESAALSAAWSDVLHHAPTQALIDALHRRGVGQVPPRPDYDGWEPMRKFRGWD